MTRACIGSNSGDSSGFSMPSQKAWFPPKIRDGPFCGCVEGLTAIVGDLDVG